MAEESDLAVDEGQPSEDLGDVFGMEAVDTPSEEPEPQSGQPGAEASTSTDTLENERGYLRQQDYSQKTMDLAEERRTFAAERETARAEDAENRRLLTEAIAAQPTPQPQADQFQNLLVDPNLPPQDRVGLQYLQDLGHKMTKMEETNVGLQKTIDEMGPRSQEMSYALDAMNQQRNDQILKEVDRQLAEANNMFGQEVVSSQMDFVKRLGMENGQWNPALKPGTDQPFTIAELVSLGSGKTGAEVTQARNGLQEGKVAAKNAIAPVGGQEVAGKGAVLSTAAAIAEIKATQEAM